MLNDLVQHFSGVTSLPIEIDEIIDQIVSMGVQDEIFLFEDDIDPTRLRGAFRRFTVPTGVYSDPKYVTHITYSQHLPIEWKRVICAKELVHIFDNKLSMTDTEEEVGQLLDRLVGPLSSEDYTPVDYQAATDRIALYRSLPLLLPVAARKIALQAVENDNATTADVAEWAAMPEHFVQLMLTDDWDSLTNENGLT